jgi:hypothetical protein
MNEPDKSLSLLLQEMTIEDLRPKGYLEAEIFAIEKLMKDRNLSIDEALRKYSESK